MAYYLPLNVFVPLNVTKRFLEFNYIDILYRVLICCKMSYFCRIN